MKIGSLFSGYGGLESGIQSVYGGTVAWHAEVEADPARILAHHWPDVPNLGDVTAVDWANVEPVDIICGGSPCQDLSHAGKRAGMRPGTRSGLWASMCDAIDIIRPALVVWENVRGALSAGAASDMGQCPICLGDDADTHLRALGRVLGDLAELGYDARWGTVRAADAGAPHGRARVFVAAADSDGGRLEGVGGLVTERRDTDGRSGSDIAWGAYEPAIRRWESVLGRPAPAPTEPGRDGPRLSPRFVEFLMGLPEGHVVDVPGISRNAALKALGNGVVPQQAALALRLLDGMQECAA